ncbi:S8 family peptidase [Actinomadura decatromicini]|uniref:S8 family serine peptidase n=1 Tax=Actinomadura decatromicini TaxID=2604572 RepID=A0A5D3F7N7_9ACTN|nr:S8 family serine peptidase [Actinomadura decatromicini]TYK43836.1 S8 family serine peptidase [Actinomadura decatromicini]
MRPTGYRAAGARTTAALALVALAGAVAVPVAIVPGGLAGARERTVRGASSGTFPGAPADQIRAREWHLNVLRATKAWKYSRGRGVTVAVLDTGVDARHPDLTGRVANGPDLTGGVRRPGSRYWGLHGTSMASIIAGHGHGPGLVQGMMGVAPMSRVLSVRVTLENDDPLRRDDGQQAGGSEHDAVAQGIRYAVDHGADIINMSLGGGRQFYNGTASQESAIKYALGKGVVLIASAGNDGAGANRKNFPAAYPGVIAVGALDRRLRLWKDSNRRSHAAVCAPGVDIVSADASNGYVVGTGTSASSAMVAGVAALVRSRYPKLTPAEVRQALIEGSPARAGHPTGSATCRGTVDALRVLFAAHQINKTSQGAVAEPPPSASARPAATTADDDGRDLLLPLVLGGGGLLIVVGLLLGWRQRRRPDDAPAETDAVPDYGLPSAPPVPREPAGAPPVPGWDAPAPAAAPDTAPPEVPSPDVAAPDIAASDIAASDIAAPDIAAPDIAASDIAASDVGPVNVLWQSAEAFPEPLPPADPPEAPLGDVPPPKRAGGSPFDPSPLDGSWDGLSWDHEPFPGGDEPEPPRQPPRQPPMMTSELRPFDPGEFLDAGQNGLNSLNGVNGHETNGHGTNGHGTNGNGHNGEHLNGGASSTNGNGNGNGHGKAPAADEPILDDDDWESFRRSSLDEPDRPKGGGTAPLPAVSPEPPADPPPPPADDGAQAAEPPEPPGDEPRGRHSRRSQPSDDEDYRPPWW